MKRLIPALAFTLAAHGAYAQINPDWITPVPAFKIAGNLYYVGTKDLASYLVATPQGLILINTNHVRGFSLLRHSVEELGFKFTDIKVILISHGHWDHDGATAAAKALSHATVMVMDSDVAVMESGGRADFEFGQDTSTWIEPVKVDRVLHDGDTVALGGAVLVAHKTAGHTKGCTTWTTQVRDGGKTLNVVIVGSPNVLAAYHLVNNTDYPGIVADYERQFRTLTALPVDIFLGAHASYFEMAEKLAHRRQGTNPFIDPTGYRAFVTDREQAFRTEWAKQKAKSND